MGSADVGTGECGSSYSLRQQCELSQPSGYRVDTSATKVADVARGSVGYAS